MTLQDVLRLLFCIVPAASTPTTADNFGNSVHSVSTASVPTTYDNWPTDHSPLSFLSTPPIIVRLDTSGEFWQLSCIVSAVTATTAPDN